MSQTKKRCHVNFLGCEKRKLDTQRIIDYLRKNGYTLSPVSQADIVVFVTCAFCQKYEDWSFGKMEKLYKEKKKDARFVVCGCITSIHPERLLESFPDAIHIQTRDLEALDSIIEPKVPMSQIPDTNITIFDKETHTYDSERLKTPAQKEYEDAKRGFKIRIAWGCLGNCSFCVTKYAEKSLTSKPAKQILSEFQKGLKAGHKTFFFTGGDTGAYGQDCSSSIALLLEQIFAIPGEYKVHFHDFGIHWLKRYLGQLIPSFTYNSKKLGCFSFPVQSGSDRILRLMRRPYKVDEIVPTLKSLKQAVPAIQIGTHFIVGFPGETEDDFQKSMDMVRSIQFDFCNIFPYTDHFRAESRLYPDKVPDETILQRYNLLFQTWEQTQQVWKETIKQ